MTWTEDEIKLIASVLDLATREISRIAGIDQRLYKADVQAFIDAHETDIRPLLKRFAEDYHKQLSLKKLAMENEKTKVDAEVAILDRVRI